MCWWCGFIGGRIQDVEEVFTSLVKQTSKRGLEIKEKKTKLMVVSWKPFKEINM